MSGGKCARCGDEKSVFWYPYAFGMAPIPSVTDPYTDRAQYFNLCDKCQADFIDFMNMKIEIKMNPHYDVNNLKKLMDDKTVPFTPEVDG